MGLAEGTVTLREFIVIASEAWRSNGSCESAPLDGFAALAMTEKAPFSRRPPTHRPCLRQT